MPRRTPPSCRSASQQPQPFVPIRSIAVLPSFTHRSPPRCLRRVPGFSLRSLLLPFTPAPLPLSSPSRNPITPRATSYVQQPNPHTRTRRVSLPPRSNRFRPCVVPRTFVSPIFSQLSSVVSPLSYRPLILRGGLAVE